MLLASSTFGLEALGAVVFRLVVKGFLPTLPPLFGPLYPVSMGHLFAARSLGNRDRSEVT